MHPSYLRNELALRLRTTANNVDPDLVSFLGLDLDAEPEEPDDRVQLPKKVTLLFAEGKPVRGVIPFELTTCVLGETMVVDCRARFVVTLQNHPSPPPGTPVRILSRLSRTYDWLEWYDYSGAATSGRMRVPRWSLAPLDPLLPPGLDSKLDQMIRDYAFDVERSNS